MKVYVSVTSKSTYIGELEMTQAEYDALNKEMDDARGFDSEEIANELVDRMGLLGEPTNVDDFEVDEFRPLPEATPSAQEAKP